MLGLKKYTIEKRIWMAEAENMEKHVECDLTRTDSWLNRGGVGRGGNGREKVTLNLLDHKQSLSITLRRSLTKL